MTPDKSIIPVFPCPRLGRVQHLPEIYSSSLRAATPGGYDPSAGQGGPAQRLGRRRLGERSGDGGQRREAVDQARDEVVGVGTGAVVQGRIGDPECRLRCRQVAVVEVDGKNRVDVVMQTGYRLVTELPAAVVEQYCPTGDFDTVEDVHRTDSDADMWCHRPPGGQVKEDIGHDRIAVAVATDPIGVAASRVVLADVGAAIAIFFFEAQWPQLVAGAPPDIEAGV